MTVQVEWPTKNGTRVRDSMSTEDTEESIEGLKQVVRQGKLTTSHDDASAAPQRQPMRRSQYALGAGDVDLWMGADVPLKTNVRAGVEPNAGNMSDDSPEFSEEEGENDQEASPVRSEDCSGGIEHTYEPSGSEASQPPAPNLLPLTHACGGVVVAPCRFLSAAHVGALWWRWW